MTCGKIKLDDDTRLVLTEAEVFEHAVVAGKTVWGLRLTGQLDRTAYTKVNKVLEVAGGKWNRGAKAHLFDGDPREILGTAVSKGEVVDSKKALGQFFTSQKLAHEVAKWAGVTRGNAVLEPSAGGGSLALAIREVYNIDPMCFEIDPHYCATLKKLGFEVWNGDFLEAVDGWFDVVIMNPPFLGNEYLKHILHAYTNFLAPGGMLTAIAPAGARTNLAQ